MKLQPWVRSTMLRHLGHCCQFFFFARFSSSAPGRSEQFVAEKMQPPCEVRHQHFE